MLITLLIVLAIIGVIWWAVTQIPMPPPLRIIAVVVVALVALLVLFQMLPTHGLHFPR